MLSSVINKLLYGKTAIGIDFCFKSENQLEINVVTLKEEKTEIVVIRAENFDSIEALLKFDSIKNSPLFLSFSGSGILQKKINGDEQESQNSLLQELLPNARLKDFYISTQSNDKNYWVGIARKEKIEPILEFFKSNNLFITDYKLGYYNFSNLSEYFNTKVINYYGKQIIFQNNVIESIDKGVNEENSLSVKLGVEGSKMLAYANAFNWFIDFNLNETDDQAFLNDSKQAYKFFKWTKALLLISISILFTALLINFLVFQSASKELANVETELYSKKSLQTKLSLLEEKLKSYKSFYSSTNIDSDSKISFYADRLAASRLDGIRWDKLSINPSVKKIKKSQDVAFQNGVIVIEGTSNSSEILNQWLNNLKSEEWVEMVNVAEYLEDKNLGRFVIEIQNK